MTNSTAAVPSVKPRKPHKDFPLYAHACGQWAKTVRGRKFYFGAWSDPQAALNEWLRVNDDLIAGREPRPDGWQFTIADVCNEFLIYCDEKVNAGTLTKRSFDDYQAASLSITKAFGRNRSANDIRPIDFQKLRKQISDGRRPKTIANWIARCKVVINFCNDNELTERPIRYGKYFDKPKASVIRRDRRVQEHRGEMDIPKKVIRAVMKDACPQLKAMILLATNTGIGNADIGRMTFKDIDLEKGWLDYPRWKTEVTRRAKLWPETIEAIRHVIASRKPPKDRKLVDVIFVTRIGKSWYKEDSTTNPISQAFTKLLKNSGNHIKGVSFYGLRRTFETIAAETKDQPAIDLSMGHESASMASLYRQRLGDRRLKAVAKHVRKWLFGKKVAKCPHYLTPRQSKGSFGKIASILPTEPRIIPACLSELSCRGPQQNEC